MRLLVTGGSGFLGARTITRLLDAGHEVVNLDVRPSSEHAQVTTVGDICEFETCLAVTRQADAILHLAGLYRDDVRPRERYHRVNVDGTRCIARAADENGVRRIIFASSFSVYGLEGAGRRESGPFDPVNDYGHSKLAAEQALATWQAQDPARQVQVLRPSVIFGEGNRGNVWTLANEIANGRFALIGRGENRKSMAYVGNVAEFLVFLLSNTKPGLEIFNYADKPDLSVREIVDIAASALGRSVRRIPLPGNTAILVGYAGDIVGRITGSAPTLNSERIRKFLADTSLPTDRVQDSGFEPPFELRAALAKTIEHDFAQARRSQVVA